MCSRNGLLTEGLKLRIRTTWITVRECVMTLVNQNHQNLFVYRVLVDRAGDIIALASEICSDLFEPICHTSPSVFKKDLPCL